MPCLVIHQPIHTQPLVTTSQNCRVKLSTQNYVQVCAMYESDLYQTFRLSIPASAQDAKAALFAPSQFNPRLLQLSQARDKTQRKRDRKQNSAVTKITECGHCVAGSFWRKNTPYWIGKAELPPAPPQDVQRWLPLSSACIDLCYQNVAVVATTRGHCSGESCAVYCSVCNSELGNIGEQQHFAKVVGLFAVFCWRIIRSRETWDSFNLGGRLRRVLQLWKQQGQVAKTSPASAKVQVLHGASIAKFEVAWIRTMLQTQVQPLTSNSKQWHKSTAGSTPGSIHSHCEDLWGKPQTLKAVVKATTSRSSWWPRQKCQTSHHGWQSEVI